MLQADEGGSVAGAAAWLLSNVAVDVSVEQRVGVSYLTLLAGRHERKSV